MKTAVRHAEVVLGVAQVELGHGRLQPCNASGTIENHRELLCDVGVPMAGRRHHVQHPLPHLVFAVLAEPFAALEQRLHLCGGRVGQ